jgi:DNA-binding transcriptional LysR family regulator
MNLIWLEDFLALAITGNFSRAAEERHTTQPAFSRRIRSLEDWLGVALFDRSTQPATLTQAGEWFRNSANDILNRVARIPEQAQAISHSNAATLKFASTHALSLTFLPKWLRSIETHITMGPIQLMSDVLQQCEVLMLQRKAQFLLSHSHQQVPSKLDLLQYPSVKVGLEAVIPVSGLTTNGKPLFSLNTRARSVTPILAYSAESGIGRLIRSLKGNMLDDAKGEVVLTAHLATVLRTMAIEGRGVAWLPRSLIEDDLNEGRLVQAGKSEWCVDVDIRLFRNPEAEPSAAEALWQAACEAQLN